MAQNTQNVNCRDHSNLLWPSSLFMVVCFLPKQRHLTLMTTSMGITLKMVYNSTINLETEAYSGTHCFIDKKSCWIYPKCVSIQDHKGKVVYEYFVVSIIHIEYWSYWRVYSRATTSPEYRVTRWLVKTSQVSVSSYSLRVLSTRP